MIVELDEILRNSVKIGYEDLSKNVPHNRGIYAAWLLINDHYECIYIGKATSSKNGGLDNRIKSHYSGQRGSDQFCLYLFDSYIKSSLDGVGAKISKLQNEKTKEWVRKYIKFTFFEINDDNIRESECEIAFRKNWNPLLNPL